MKSLIVLCISISTLACAEPNYATKDKSRPLAQSNPVSENCGAVFKNSNNCLNWRVEQEPTQDQMGSFTFTLSHNPLGSIKVVLWMPSMGHGSSPVKVEQLGDRQYRASQVYFSMPGKWQIRFQIKDNNQVLDEAVIEVEI
ncbi:MAG: FixH family protein [Oligoflexia bacterium]|nr:FixH family protein [Oligoflexia bacterium]